MIASFTFILSVAEITVVSYCQFLNGPSRNPPDTFKNFRNVPRFRGPTAVGNFQRTNLNYVQQNGLRFQQELDRRDAEGSDSNRGYPGNIETSQYSIKGFCRDGWTEASINGVEICIRVNTEALSWDEALENCRKDYSFLLKLEVPVRVQSKTIQEHLLSLGKIILKVCKT